MSAIVGEFIVERVISELARGCIFSARDASGKLKQVKYQWPKDHPIAPVPGEAYEIEGTLSCWRDKFGKDHDQILARAVERVRTSGSLMKPWLQKLPGVGPVRADVLLTRFGADLPSVLANPALLEEVARTIDPVRPTLGLATAQKIYAAMAEKDAQEAMAFEEMRFMQHLEAIGVVNVRVARRMWQLLGGMEWKQTLEANPYLAAHFIGWSAADELGRKLLRAGGAVRGGISKHPQRLLGAVWSAWREVRANGDTAATAETMERLLSARGVDPSAAILLATEKRAIGRTDALLRAPGAMWLEDHLACLIDEVEHAAPLVTVPEGEELVHELRLAENATKLTLDGEQPEAVLELMRRPVSVLQGGAGYGKTTVMRVVVAMWERFGGNVLLGALAGKAALELSRGVSTKAHGRMAFTVARLVNELQRAKQTRKRSGQQQLDGMQIERLRKSDIYVDGKTLLILDEASMLDTPSLHEILTLLPTGARLLLVGDHGQLPPVGIGKVFHDMVYDGSRVSSLTKPRRTGKGSVIPVVANAVRNGDLPDLPAWSGQIEGVSIVQDGIPLTSIYEQLLSTSSDVLVVAALKKTVDDFNEAAAKARRPAGCRLANLGLVQVAEGDPVVCTANRYKDGLVNGLLGRVLEVNENGTEVMIHWDGNEVPTPLPKEAREDIDLAYAVTCHKAQGSAARHVIVAVERSRIVTREWLYTAITRAKHNVVLVGAVADISAAVDRRENRVTGFRLMKTLNATACDRTEPVLL